jgi:hypothetical protein
MLKPTMSLLAICTFFLATARAADSFAIKVADKDQVAISLGEKTVATFMIANDKSTPQRHHDTYKPYLHVFDLAGNRLTKGPGFQFTHHRGIFLGFSKISFDGKSYDRWHMKGGDQVVTEVVPKESGFLAAIDWQGESAEPFLKEQRQFTFTTGPGPFFLGVEMASSIRTVTGEAELNGDPEHAGAQFRPSELVDTKTTTYLLPGEKVNAHKQKDLPWAAEIFTIEGKTYTVLLLNHPDNPQDTAISAYRDYGRFGAFPKGKATATEPFSLRYKWLVAAGDIRDATVIQDAWNQFTGKQLPAPSMTVRLSEQPNKK